MIRLDFAREWVLLFENARAAKAPPLMRRRVRPALVLGSSPDRLGGRVSPHAARVVERNPEVIAKRRLSLPANLAGILVALKHPFPGNVGWCAGTGRLREGRDTCQHERYHKNEPVRRRFPLV